MKRVFWVCLCGPPTHGRQFYACSSGTTAGLSSRKPDGLIFLKASHVFALDREQLWSVRIIRLPPCFFFRFAFFLSLVSPLALVFVSFAAPILRAIRGKLIKDRSAYYSSPSTALAVVDTFAEAIVHCREPSILFASSFSFRLRLNEAGNKKKVKRDIVSSASGVLVRLAVRRLCCAA